MKLIKLLNIAAAAVIGVGAGVAAVSAPSAQADPPGTQWCWSHLTPAAQECPAIPPWGTRWTECPDGLFVLDNNLSLCGTSGYDPDQTYTFNCWGHDMILGQICPSIPPGPDAWLPCPNMPGKVYTLTGSCSKP